MKKLDQLTQISYEISMSIGMSLSLSQMLRDVALVTLRKLNCTAFVVFMQRQVKDQYHFERVFITPDSFLESDEYASLEQMLPDSLNSQKYEDFLERLPLEMAFEDGKCLHLMTLPGYGLIAIFRAQSFLPQNVIYSFDSLNKKLAVACQACLSHENLDELLKIRTFELEEKKKAEEALRQSEATLRSIFKASPIGIGMVVDRIFTMVNDKFCEIVEYSRDELINMSSRNLYPSEEEFNWVGEERVLQKGTGTVETQMIKKSGEAADILLSSTPLDPSDLSKGVTFTALDITDRKRAEDQLRASEKTYREIFNGSNDVIFIHDIDSGAIMDVNSKVNEVYGYHPADLYGLTADFLSKGEPPFSSAEATEWIQKAMELGPQVFQWMAKNKDGEAFWVEVSLKRTVIGGKERLMAVVRDIRQRKANEQKLREYHEHLEELVEQRTAEIQFKNKELETFTYSVSHDLKAPLRGIDGYSRLLEEEYADKLDEDGLFFLNNVRQSTTQMNKLIEDLLAYSRMERKELYHTSIDLKSLIDNLVAQRAHDIEQCRIKLTVELPFQTIETDTETLRQVLANYLDNAIKYSKKDTSGTVTIAGSHDDDYWTMWVKDSGIGFDPKYTDRIFDIFQRLHRVEEYPGTGVGLAIARKAVERIGGSVRANSSPGKGSTFYLYIPKNKQFNQ